MPIYRNFAVVMLLVQSTVLGFSYQAYLYYIPLYLQNAHQFSALTSALVYMPLVLLQSTFSVLSGQYIAWRKRYTEVIGFGFGMWTV